jgi:uncharacterized protein YecT (DUF1311 family)
MNSSKSFMPKLILAALFAASLAAPLAAQSPGFDCAKATTPVEKAICADQELSKADADMSAAYRAWLDAAPPDQQEGIRQSQRAWLHDRLTQCLSQDKTTVSSSCLLDTEKSRTKALSGMVEHHNGIAFVWSSIHLTAPDSPDVAKMMRDTSRPDSGYVDASWPQATSNDPEWAAWNKAIANAAGPSGQGERKAGTQWTKDDAVDSDTDVTVTLNSVSDSVISASVFVETYGHGAAHPNHGASQFNWMLKEQRPLLGKDVFQPQSDWGNELYDRINKYLHKALDADGKSYENWLNDPKGMQKTVHGIATDPNRWQIDDKGITIVFIPYEVACYACTPEDFTMSWDSLKPLLNPAFVIPGPAR